MTKFSAFFRHLFIFFLLGFAAATGTSRAYRAVIAEMSGPGFLYTRTRGRCTPEFWGSRRETWPRMVSLTSSVSKIFGSRAMERYKPGLTMLEATEINDESNPFHHLLRQSTAALLNSYARKGFPYSAWDVKTLLIQALVSEKAAALQASRFSTANQACT